MQEIFALVSFLALSICHFAVRAAASGADVPEPTLLQPSIDQLRRAAASEGSGHAER